MPDRNNQYLCFPLFRGLPGIFLLLGALLHAGWACGAESPFEIEIGELERTEAVSKEVKKAQPKPSAKKRRSKTVAMPAESAGGQHSGEYARYTIRPGDHIYKILTTRFGLSSAKAEQLIPEVMRINGISNTSGLQIGQTILLPLSRKKAAVPARTVPVPVEAAPIPVEAAPVPTETVPVLPSVAEVPATAAPIPPLPELDEGMVRRARQFWAQLFPERPAEESGAGMKAAGSGQVFLLTGVDGREIRLVPPGKPPVFGNLSGAGTENRETVVADPANEKGFVKELLQAAGFATADGGAPLQFGNDPKLSVQAEFTAAKLTPATEPRKTILVVVAENGCLDLPESSATHLAAKGIRLLEWCDSSVKTPDSPHVRFISVPPGSSAVVADAVLDALSLKANRDYPIEIVVGATGSAPLRATVDRYFERQGVRYFLDFGSSDAGRATLLRLLELAGYRRIVLAETDDLPTVAEKISKAVTMPVEYRKHAFTSIPGGRYELEVSGILFQPSGVGGQQTFLTDIPLEQPYSDLLKTVPWGTR
ncbi:MAG: LysM peptidoglycan-binding domain-containing protein [Geobacteraceae bacterium]|nr:LysM peptidoglycan-binding domain-containing protein [Geobacteraceae bacterium]